MTQPGDRAIYKAFDVIVFVFLLIKISTPMSDTKCNKVRGM